MKNVCALLSLRQAHNQTPGLVFERDRHMALLHSCPIAHADWEGLEVLPWLRHSGGVTGMGVVLLCRDSDHLMVRPRSLTLHSPILMLLDSTAALGESNGDATGSNSRQGSWSVLHNTRSGRSRDLNWEPSNYGTNSCHCRHRRW